jgi:hypothetical protein
VKAVLKVLDKAADNVDLRDIRVVQNLVNGKALARSLH